MKNDCREERYSNRFFSIDDLPLSDAQKRCVLEWFARKCWIIIEEGTGDKDYYGKSYDPLVIHPTQNEAWSYVFRLHDGGRRHAFSSLSDIEDAIVQEVIEEIDAIRTQS